MFFMVDTALGLVTATRTVAHEHIAEANYVREARINGATILDTVRMSRYRVTLADRRDTSERIASSQNPNFNNITALANDALALTR